MSGQPLPVPLADGTVSGIRHRTSLAIDDDCLTIAREHAKSARLDMSTWIENAIRSYAADEDTVLYEQWRATLSEEDIATAATLDAAANADLETELRSGNIAA